MKQAKSATTSEQFHAFCEAGRKYQLLLGLTDWEIHYWHGTETDDAEASCDAQMDARRADIRLTKTVKLTDKDVAGAALHEMLELLFTPLDTLARRRYVNESELERERHAAIRRLEEALNESARV